MSINLSVDPYCKDCPEFYPDSSMIRYLDNDGKPRTLVYVYCSHRDGCRHAVEHAGEKDDAEPQTTGEDLSTEEGQQ